MTTQSKRTVAFALCGSFCSFAAVLPQLRVLTARGWDVLPVLSASAAGLDTRFGTASALRQTLYEVTGHRPLTTLQAVEPLGPQRLAEALIIAPATGTTMALPGVSVAAKTGTAETGEGERANAWAIGFAPADKPKIAFAVLVEGDDETTTPHGGDVAGPVALDILEAGLKLTHHA